MSPANLQTYARSPPCLQHVMAGGMLPADWWIRSLVDCQRVIALRIYQNILLAFAATVQLFLSILSAFDIFAHDNHV